MADFTPRGTGAHAVPEARSQMNERIAYIDEEIKNVVAGLRFLALRGDSLDLMELRAEHVRAEVGERQLLSRAAQQRFLRLRQACRWARGNCKISIADRYRAISRRRRMATHSARWVAKASCADNAKCGGLSSVEHNAPDLEQGTEPIAASNDKQTEKEEQQGSLGSQEEVDETTTNLDFFENQHRGPREMPKRFSLRRATASRKPSPNWPNPVVV